MKAIRRLVQFFDRRLLLKGRKYPIRYDEFRRSARKRAFQAYDGGLNPSQVAHMVGISIRTARRYRHDWKRQPQNLELRCRLLKAAFKSNPGLRQEITKLLAAKLGISEEQALARLQKPWALKQLVSGQWRKWKDEEKEATKRKQ